MAHHAHRRPPRPTLQEVTRPTPTDAARWHPAVAEMPEGRAAWLAVWLARAVLAIATVVAILARQPLPALAGLVTFGASFVPRLIGRSAAVDLPRWFELVWVLAVGLIGASTALNVYDHLQHWGKFVHGAEGFLVALLVGSLLLGYRDQQSIGLSDQLGGLLTIMLGVAFGVVWEIIEFVIDWVADTSLQKSNTDTMTDFLWNDLGAVIGALLIVRLYCHWLSAHDRRAVGSAGTWLVDGPSRVLDRHGWLITVLGVAVIALIIAALWFAGRPIPGLATGG